MNGQRYDVILFDADRTLFDFDQSQRLALLEVYESAGIPRTEKMIQTYVKLNGRLWGRFDRGEVSLDELVQVRFRSFLEQIGVTGRDPDEMNQQYIAALGRNSILLPGAEELCAALAPHCRLYIVTNGIQEAQEGRLKRSPIRKYIEKMYISGVMGVRKPEAAYFRMVCDDLQITPEQRRRTVIVGDSLASDIQGGINAGLDSIWYNPKGKHNDSPVQPTWEADSFAAVYGLIMGETERDKFPNK